MINKEAMDTGFIKRCAARGITNPDAIHSLMKVANSFIAKQEEQEKKASDISMIQDLIADNPQLAKALIGALGGGALGAGGAHMAGRDPYLGGLAGAVGGGAGLAYGDQIRAGAGKAMDAGSDALAKMKAMAGLGQ